MSHHPDTDAPATVVVADDNDDLRLLVRSHLSRDARFRLAAEVADGRAAVDAVAQHQPDLILLDLRMPRMDGLEAMPQVLTRSPRTMVVALSDFDEQVIGGAAQARGAFAYLEKDTIGTGFTDQLHGLLQEFRRALAGDTVIAPARPAQGDWRPPRHA
ncbi:MAG: response regulator transcription factor [Actinobacteria bacterium]|nr:response regulator transcription factor [Actinomycetota bacterium]